MILLKCGSSSFLGTKGRVVNYCVWVKIHDIPGMINYSDGTFYFIVEATSPLKGEEILMVVTHPIIHVLISFICEETIKNKRKWQTIEYACTKENQSWVA